MKVAKITLESSGVACVTAAVALRLLVALVVLLAAFVCDHDGAMRLVAVVCALLCGAALIWEEATVESLKLLFGSPTKALYFIVSLPQMLLTLAQRVYIRSCDAVFL